VALAGVAIRLMVVGLLRQVSLAPGWADGAEPFLIVSQVFKTEAASCPARAYDPAENCGHRQPPDTMALERTTPWL